MNTSILATILIVLLLIAVLSSLFSGLYFLIRDQGKTKRTLKALTVRITLSFVLFLLLMIGFLSGWIRPHSILGTEVPSPKLSITNTQT